MRDMKLIYVTARLPYGRQEPFLIPEIAELGRRGNEVIIVPARPTGPLVHSDAELLLSSSVCEPLLSFTVLRAATLEFVRAPAACARAFSRLTHTRRPRIFLKNISAYPKGLWLGRFAREIGAEHLHVHWAGVSATMAMIASEVSGIGWSLTAHRWDIVEGNLLGEKARRARFVRAINERGAKMLEDLVRIPDWHPWVLHMGVQVPASRAAGFPPEPPLRVLMPANFVAVKGHSSLIRAVELLSRRGIAVRLELAGDGSLEPAIRRQVSRLGVGDHVQFLGRLSHERLLERLSDGEWHVVVLTSVMTAVGEEEGTPVALMEAMACGIPVIGTETGGIPELLRDGAGLVVPPNDPEALAEALRSLAGRPALRSKLGAEGRKRIAEHFCVETVTAALEERFRHFAFGS
jgi:glycosyltransferase involved in cell wall biosynthesis